MHCLACGECRFVSFSSQTNDCSLYRACNLSNVAHGFRYQSADVAATHASSWDVSTQTDPPCEWHGCPIHNHTGWRDDIVYADFRCPKDQSWSTHLYRTYRIYAWHYHRIVDCFVPLLPLLHRVLEYQAKGATHLVALAQSKSVAPYLRALVPSLRIALSDADPIANAPLLHLPSCCLAAPNASVLLEHYKTVWFGSRPSPALVAESWARHTVLISRRIRWPRYFTPATFSRLATAINSTRSPLRIFTGTEPLFDQLRLFNGAESIIGYHGAGLANAAFSWRACVHEISTFRTLSLDPSDVWATNKVNLMRRANTLQISWHIHMLPLMQLLERHRAHVNLSHVMEQLHAGHSFGGQIGFYEIVLYEAQANALKYEVRSCTLAWARGNGVPPDSQQLLAGSRTDW